MMFQEGGKWPLLFLQATWGSDYGSGYVGQTCDGYTRNVRHHEVF